jgi:dolichyl-diphosphooligosaccharide--protein glycosyltransferase
VLSVYAWWFLLLSVIQLRFAGQLALFTAVFGGLGFVHLAAWVDVASVPKVFESASGPSQSSLAKSADGGRGAQEEALDWPERRDAIYLAGLGLGVGSLGLLNTPIKHSQLMIEESRYKAAGFMKEYSTEKGWEYPDNYVLSQWGQNRAYNWFVNGESQSYGFAFANYEDFIMSMDGAEWYEQLRDRVGFVVTESGRSIDRGEESIYEKLWGDDFGLKTDHYRAVWSDKSESRRVYTLVPGVRVTGPMPEGEKLTIEGEVMIGDRSEQIRGEVSVNHGVYDTTLPLPGRYEIGSRTVDLSESDVVDGSLMPEFEHEAAAYWSFNEGSGEWAYDRAGGRHAQLQKAEWTEGVLDNAVQLSGDAYLRGLSIGGHSVSTFTISAWIRPGTEASGAILSLGKDGGSNSVYGILFDHGLSGWHNDRLGLYLGDGDSSYHRNSPHLGFSYPVEVYHHVAIVFDRGNLRWFVDGEKLSEGSVPVETVSFQDDRPIYIGREYSGYGGLTSFQGDIDELRYYESALSAEQIQSL